MKLISFCILLGLVGSVEAAVYKYVDEQGNIIFSDRKRDDAVEQTLSEPSIVPPPAKKTRKSTDQPEKPVENAKPVVIKYKKLKIKSPEHDQVVRNNAGNISVSVVSTPKFGADPAHRIIAYLDGKKLKNTWRTGNFTLTNIDRGSHRLKVAIIDSKNNKLLKTSGEIVFHLQRFSVLHGN